MIKKFLFVIVFLALTYPCFPQGSTPKASDPVVFIGNGEAIQHGFEIRQGEKLKISTVDNESSDPHWKILSYRIKIIKQGDITIDEVCLGDSLNSRIVQLIHELPTYSTVVFHNIIVTSEVGACWLKGFAVVIDNIWDDGGCPTGPDEPYWDDGGCPTGPDDDDPPLLITEEEPEFPGGMEALKTFLHNETHYPAEAKEQGVVGNVYVNFVVERDGSISNPKVLGRLFPQCDEEAVRVIMSMPKWTPGKNMGKPVRTRFLLAVPFELP